MATRNHPASTLWTAGVAAALFGVLLVLVLTGWSPLLRADQSVAEHATSVTAAHHWVRALFGRVTRLGDTSTLVVVTAVAAVALAVTRRFRAALVVALAYGVELILGPLIKTVVGRVRPVVEHPVAHAGGRSFPSGHAFGSLACYGAIALVVVAAFGIEGRRGRTAVGSAILIAFAVGVSRVMLGVHFVSDVLAGWCLGALVLCAVVFSTDAVKHRPGP